MKQIKISEILSFLKSTNFKFEYIGDLDIKVKGFTSLEQYNTGCFTWVKQQDNWKEEYAQKDILLIIVQEGCKVDAKNQIISEESRNVFFSIINHFYETDYWKPGIGQGTVVGENVFISEKVSIGNNCSIVGEIKIGEGTIIEDNVVIRNRVSIGKNCHVQSGCVLGEDGFGFIENAEHEKTMIKHYGGLIIGDNVFIGMHTNIARGVLDDTVISDGVKIAPTSHIGHNNYIDENAIFICSQSYGSAHIGKDAYVVGSIIRNHCTVGSQSMVGMGSVVTKSIPENKIVMGVPARVAGDRYKKS